MKPGNVFLYDSLDKRNPDKTIYRENRDFRVTLVHYAGIFSGVFILLFIGLLSFWMTQSENVFFRNLGYIITAVIALAFSVLLIAATIIGIFWLANRMKRSGLVNVLEYQTDVDRLVRAQVIDQYFDVANRRADRSTFSGVENLTYAPHNSNRYEGIAPQQITLDENEVQNAEEIPLLNVMIEKGLINRSHESMLLGFIEE